LRFLLDQGVPWTAVEILSRHGIKAQHVSELGMSTSLDIEILEYARMNSLTVITLDADFHTLLAVNCEHTPSVIRIRQEGLGAEAFAKLLVGLLPTISEPLTRGAAVTVTETHVRIRRLPVRSNSQV